MKNIIILGCGRSGTSLVAGLLSHAGYYMGSHLYPPSESNPKGYFESDEINRINEEILEKVEKKRPPILGRWFFQNRPLTNQRWLSRISLDTKWKKNAAIEKKISGVIQKKPYCLKDPRFSYTLPVWRPYLNNILFICVFRDPGQTVQSIVKECEHVPYLKTLAMTRDLAFEIWHLMYRHILEIHHKEGKWLFLNYHDVLYGTGLNRLSSFTGIEVDKTFPDSGFHRSQTEGKVPISIQKTYEKLQSLAGL